MPRFSPEWWTFWAGVWAIGLMAAAAGAGVVSWWFGIAVSQRYEERTRAMEKDIADARRSADEAHAAYEALKLQTVNAERDAAAAKAVAATAGEGTAAALAHLARANERAEADRLARMKLEATIAPRRLSPSQLASIASRLRQFNGRILMLSSFGTDVDSAILAQQIASAAKSAGLGVASQIGGLVGGPLRTGVHVDLFTDSADTEFAEAVRSALDGLGLSVAPKVGRASKGGSKLNPASVSVFVGPKPTAR